MLCSVLIRHGVGQLSVIERDLSAWMDEHEYVSVQQLRGQLEPEELRRPERLRARAVHARAIELPRQEFVSPTFLLLILLVIVISAVSRT